MLEKWMGLLGGALMGFISHAGYLGISLLMALESACLPLPSEVIMPFAGYLAYQGTLTLWAVALAGAVGCVVGSWAAYALGAWGGRRAIERFGKYVLLSSQDLDRADRWFSRYGEIIIFVGRLLPVVRTFIALPAGISHMPFWRFTLYTFVGSLIWCWCLAWVGLKMGEHWDTLGAIFHRFDAVIIAIFVLGLAWFVWHRVRDMRRSSS
ncbi:DedA family protein [Dyella sp.]|uniref:DedA family protein n=1 Tax=Dyella sp. TaxID=1869338 RepID=UPI002D79217D|nr:DedA family protein [Dyella sp.]HET6431275.1 DedA family protein [Dyella sp.]